MDTYLDILIGGKYYKQRRENSKIIRYDYDLNNPHYFSIKEELPTFVQEEIEKVKDIQEHPEDYFEYEKINDKSIRLTSFRNHKNAMNVFIPKSINGMDVTKIGSIFFMHNSVVRIVMPDTVEELSEAMCHGCKDLKEVVLSPNITEIPSGCFMACFKLNKINVENIQFFGTDSFRNCSELININLNSAILADDGSFQDCYKIKEINAPKLIEIGNSAFRECNSLERITTSPYLTKMKYSAFKACCNLEEIYLPDTLKEIPEHCFENCTLLSKVRYPAKLQKIGFYAFARTNLEEITLPNTVQLIEAEAFSDIKFKKINLSKNTLYSGVFDNSEICKINFYDKDIER